MIASRPGSGRPCPGTDCVVMVSPPPRFASVLSRRQDSAPECEVGASSDIPGGCVVVLLRRTNHTTRRPPTSPGGTVTTPTAATLFTDLAPAQRLERAAVALTAHGFT